jgi:hypothetical protein
MLLSQHSILPNSWVKLSPLKRFGSFYSHIPYHVANNDSFRHVVDGPELLLQEGTMALLNAVCFFFLPSTKL